MTHASLLGDKTQLSLMLISVWQNPTEIILELHACDGKQIWSKLPSQYWLAYRIFFISYFVLQAVATVIDISKHRKYYWQTSLINGIINSSLISAFIPTLYTYQMIQISLICSLPLKTSRKNTLLIMLKCWTSAYNVKISIKKKYISSLFPTDQKIY